MGMPDPQISYGPQRLDAFLLLAIQLHQPLLVLSLPLPSSKNQKQWVGGSSQPPDTLLSFPTSSCLFGTPIPYSGLAPLLSWQAHSLLLPLEHLPAPRAPSRCCPLRLISSFPPHLPPVPQSAPPETTRTRFYIQIQFEHSLSPAPGNRLTQGLHSMAGLPPHSAPSAASSVGPFSAPFW